MSDTLPEDNLAGDLEKLSEEIFEDNRITMNSTRKLLFMEKLTIYIVDRDHKVLEHGIKLGKGKQ